jgi:alpha-L-rhamnosidase
MHTSALEHTPWIARPVPTGQRIARSIRRDRAEWIGPGHSLTQAFRAEGPMMSVNVDIAGVRGVDDPYTEDVRFTLDVETARGDVVSRLVVDGPQLLWERFGRLI